MSEICVSKFHQIASLGLKFGRRPVKNKPLRAGLQWEVGGGMGPVISAGLEGTLGQKCMTQQKKKGRSSASALMLMADLGPWLWAALQTKEEQPPLCPTSHRCRPGLVWETSGTVRWSTSVGNISAPQTGRGTFTKKKKKRRNRKFTWSVAFKWGRSNTTCSFVTVIGSERGGVCSAFTNFCIFKVR